MEDGGIPEFSLERLRCEICGFLTKSKASLKRHQVIHSSKLATCHDCGKQFVNEKGLLLHVTKMHKIKKSKNEEEDRTNDLSRDSFESDQATTSTKDDKIIVTPEKIPTHLSVEDASTSKIYTQDDKTKYVSKNVDNILAVPIPNSSKVKKRKTNKKIKRKSKSQFDKKSLDDENLGDNLMADLFDETTIETSVDVYNTKSLQEVQADFSDISVGMEDGSINKLDETSNLSDFQPPPDGSCDICPPPACHSSDKSPCMLGCHCRICQPCRNVCCENEAVRSGKCCDPNTLGGCLQPFLTACFAPCCHSSMGLHSDFKVVNNNIEKREMITLFNPLLVQYEDNYMVEAEYLLRNKRSNKEDYVTCDVCLDDQCSCYEEHTPMKSDTEHHDTELNTENNETDIKPKVKRRTVTDHISAQISEYLDRKLKKVNILPKVIKSKENKEICKVYRDSTLPRGCKVVHKKILGGNHLEVGYKAPGGEIFGSRLELEQFLQQNIMPQVKLNVHAELTDAIYEDTIQSHSDLNLSTNPTKSVDCHSNINHKNVDNMSIEELEGTENNIATEEASCDARINHSQIEKSLMSNEELTTMREEYHMSIPSSDTAFSDQGGKMEQCLQCKTGSMDILSYNKHKEICHEEANGNIKEALEVFPFNNDDSEDFEVNESAETCEKIESFLGSFISEDNECLGNEETEIEKLDVKRNVDLVNKVKDEEKKLLQTDRKIEEKADEELSVIETLQERGIVVSPKEILITTTLPVLLPKEVVNRQSVNLEPSRKFERRKRGRSEGRIDERHDILDHNDPRHPTSSFNIRMKGRDHKGFRKMTPMGSLTNLFKEELTKEKMIYDCVAGELQLFDVKKECYQVIRQPEIKTSSLPRVSPSEKKNIPARDISGNSVTRITSSLSLRLKGRDHIGKVDIRHMKLFKTSQKVSTNFVKDILVDLVNSPEASKEEYFTVSS